MAIKKLPAEPDKYHSKTSTSRGWLEKQISSSSAALDPESIRNANKCQLLIFRKGDPNSYDIIYDAYCSTNWQHNASVEFGGFADGLAQKLAGFSSFGVNRALLKGAGENGFSQSWSGIFDAPINPYLKGVSRFSGQQVETMLPLIVKDGEQPYTAFDRCILQPIQTLYQLTLPDATEDLTPTVREWVKRKIEDWSGWLKKGHTAAERGLDENGREKGDNYFFTIPADGVLGLKEYIDGLQMLNNPLQALSDVDLTLCIGQMRYPSILITGINVKFEQNVYTDMYGNVYPALASVTLTFTSKWKNRCDTVYFGASESSIIKKYRGR